MNKRFAGLAAITVIVTIIALWCLLRIPSIGNAHSVVSTAVQTALLVLGFPVVICARLFVGQGSWPLPLLISVVALSGIIWGLIIERLAFGLTKQKQPGE